MQDSASHSAGLDELDLALQHVQRLWGRKRLRHWFSAELGQAIELSTVRTLRAIERSGPAPSVGTIAAAMSVAPSTATRSIDRAVDDGFALRRSSPDDGRRIHVELTGEGHRVLDRSTAIRRQGLATATDGWPDEDVTALTSLLLRLSVGFDRVGASDDGTL